jgi:hypothetical protein
MSDDPEGGKGSAEDAEAEAERRRRRARVFGDVLPETTRDDRADDWEPGSGGEAGDDWLRRQVPPHHGT